jgi:hypothetical protein
MFLFWSAIVLLFVWFYKPLRFYLLSYFFEWLFVHQTVGRLLGIRYIDDVKWETNRNETYVYMSGIFIWIFTKFTGMDVILTNKTRHEFLSLQQRLARNINMEPYFKEIENKTMTAEDFENFLSRSVLIETNKVFEILDTNTEETLLKHIMILRNIVNGLTGGMVDGFKMVWNNFGSILEISRILKSVPEHQRLLLYVPQLTLINNFSMMLAETKGDMNRFQPHEFLDAKVKFSVFVSRGQLVLVERIKDSANTEMNRAFGPKMVICPGNIYTMRFVKSILAFLQSFDIKVEGKEVFEGKRFANFMNKKDVTFKFTKDSDEVVNVDKWDS